MAERLHILIAEDDRDLLELTRTILAPAGEVDTADHPGPALRLITAREYQLLVTDLNICHPCDGLLLASAMRTLYPRSRTVLLTGNPDFAHVLLFIQSTLDLIVLKPVDPDVLRNLPGLVAAAPPDTAGLHAPGKASMAEVLFAHRTEILASWMKMVEADPALGQLPLAEEQRLDHIAHLLDGLAGVGREVEADRLAAEAHGRLRRAQNYSPDGVATELSYLRRAAMEAVLNYLLDLDLSHMPNALHELQARLDADLLCSLKAYGLLSERGRAG